jgi:hypothetical protein
MTKRIVIPKENLPDIDSLTESYAVRFRLITEDGNKLSYWSPIFSVNPGFTYVSGEINIAKNAQQVSVVWDSVRIEKDGVFVGQAQQYDIWLRWSKNNENGDWIYKERVQTTSTNFIIPSTFFFQGVNQNDAPNRLTVEIFLKASPITRTNTDLLVYNPAMQTI